MRTIFLPALCLAKVDRHHLFFCFPFLCSLWWVCMLFFCLVKAKWHHILFFFFPFFFLFILSDFFLFLSPTFFRQVPYLYSFCHIPKCQYLPEGRLYTKLGPCFLHLVTQFLQLPLRGHPLIVWRPEGLHFWAPQRLYSWVPQYYNQWRRNL